MANGTSSYLEQMKAHFSKHNRTKTYSNHDAKVHSVDWSADGRKLASGSFDKTVTIYSLDKDSLTKENTFRGHGDR